MNIAGKMKITVGKSILIGDFIAFSSAAAWRLRRESAACTRRMRPSEMPELVGLDDRAGEARDLGRRRALGELLERVVAALADPHLAERERELLGERAFHVLGQLGDRAVEAETGLDRDGEQVERVRQLRADRLAALARPHRDDEARGDEADAAESDRKRERRDRAADGDAADEARGTRRRARPRALTARNVVGVSVRPMPAASSRAEIESSVMRGLSRSTMPASERRGGQRGRARGSAAARARCSTTRERP